MVKKKLVRKLAKKLAKKKLTKKQRSEVMKKAWVKRKQDGGSFMIRGGGGASHTPIILNSKDSRNNALRLKVIRSSLYGKVTSPSEQFRKIGEAVALGFRDGVKDPINTSKRKMSRVEKCINVNCNNLAFEKSSHCRSCFDNDDIVSPYVIGLPSDSVNHPSHYTSHPSGIECIQITEHMNFNLGNCVKYVWRADLKSKNPIQDLQKARWYIDREIAKLEKKSS